MCKKSKNTNKNGEKIMRNKVQMSLFDIYNDVSEVFENKKPKLVMLLEEHIDFNSLIPASFSLSFYKRFGRNRTYSLECFIRALVLQKLLGIPSDKLLLDILKCSSELTDFCGFKTIPDASQLTRFKQNFSENLKAMFETLVDLTEPICREIDAKKSDYLIYDTTGIELRVAENNPKFFNTKLKQAKTANKGTAYNAYATVYGLLPDYSKTNSSAKQQYINGHYCYALKMGVLTNGLGIIRDLTVFDDTFKKSHPEMVTFKTDSPDTDKEIGDSVSLKPVLYDFFFKHKDFSYSTFIGDSSFDKYDTYSMLKYNFGFTRTCIPLNQRNTKSSNTLFDKYGTPICPLDKTPFTYLGKSGGENRSLRFKWVCHKSVPNGSKRICTCDTPCTDSTYGKCTYTYPDKNLRLYPGIPRNTEHWDNLYRHRVVIERSIFSLKDTFAIDGRKSFNTKTAKADIYLAGIVQLLGVILADSMHKHNLYKSIRRLIA